MRAGDVPLWWWWSLAVLVVSLPWFGFTTTPQWDRVHVVPFTDPDDKPTDLVVNISLFVPFGFLFAAGRRDAAGPLYGYAALAAAIVSVGVETPQLFSTLRNPSATDVLYAIVGATAGAALYRGVRKP